MSSDAIAMALGLILGMLAFLPGAMFAAQWRRYERDQPQQVEHHMHIHIHGEQRQQLPEWRVADEQQQLEVRK